MNMWIKPFDGAMVRAKLTGIGSTSRPSAVFLRPEFVTRSRRVRLVHVAPRFLLRPQKSSR